MGIVFLYDFVAQIFVISSEFGIGRVLHPPEMHPPPSAISCFPVKFAHWFACSEIEGLLRRQFQSGGSIWFDFWRFDVGTPAAVARFFFVVFGFALWSFFL